VETVTTEPGVSTPCPGEGRAGAERPRRGADSGGAGRASAAGGARCLTPLPSLGKGDGEKPCPQRFAEPRAAESGGEGRLCAPGQSYDKSRPSRTRETRDGRQVRPRGAEGAGQDRWTGAETGENARKHQVYTYFFRHFSHLSPLNPPKSMPRRGAVPRFAGETCGKGAETVPKVPRRLPKGQVKGTI
jgi:hypothetical protein